MKKILNLLFIAVICTISLVACNGEADKKTGETAKAPVVPNDPTTKPAEIAKDVVDIAIESADHKTLVAAVKAAELVETLKGDGPFTIFAPTDAAFAALPAGTVDGLLKAEKKADLTSILTYHVVAGNVKAADLKDGQVVKTLQGTDLKVTKKDGKVAINGANVTTADLAGSNGVIHVIDAVLMPKK